MFGISTIIIVVCVISITPIALTTIMADAIDTSSRKEDVAYDLYTIFRDGLLKELKPMVKENCNIIRDPNVIKATGEGGHIEVLQLMISCGLTKSDMTPGYYPDSLPYIACRHNSLDMVKYLVNHLNFTASELRQCRVILASCLSKNIDMFKYLCGLGCLPDSIQMWNAYELKAITKICEQNNTEFFELFFDHGLNADFLNEFSAGTFNKLLSAEAGSLEMIKIVIKRGGLTAEDLKSTKTWNMICQAGNTDVAMHLFSLGINVEEVISNDMLKLAIQNDHLRFVQTILNSMDLTPL
jgi:hypothetical protein